MKQIDTIPALRRELDAARSAGRTIGFVPTMGFLHEGHASLMDTARAATDVVVTSIFVNPLQFAPTEDLDAYPRDLERDSALVVAHGVDILFTPPVDEMYPQPVDTSIIVAGPSEPLEGASRPTHFAGVATVVAKLFSIVGPCHAFFGEKDIQQLAVIRTMVRDLSMPITVVGCPTVREADGLAMSSRNKYLTADERSQAPVVNRALRSGVAAVLGGECDPRVVRTLMAEIIATAPLGTVDYVEVVDAVTFRTPDILSGELRFLAAVQFGGARLIDNVGATVPDESLSNQPRGATALAASTQGEH